MKASSYNNSGCNLPLSATCFKEHKGAIVKYLYLVSVFPPIQVLFTPLGASGEFLIKTLGAKG